MISSMVRNAIIETASRQEIRDAVDRFDDTLVACIQKELHKQPLPTLSATSSATIQHEIQQRILELVREREEQE